MRLLIRDRERKYIEKLRLIFFFLISIYGAFVTGDNEGYVIAWDARSKKRLLEVFSILVLYDSACDFGKILMSNQLR